MKLAVKVILASSLCAVLTACSRNTSSVNDNANSNTGGRQASSSPPSSASPAQASMNTSMNSVAGDEKAKDKASTPEDAARQLYTAWKSNDRAAASHFASSGAVNELFKTRGDDPEARDWEFGSCEKSGKGFDCDYYYEGGGSHFIVEGSPEKGYRVISVRFIAD